MNRRITALAIAPAMAVATMMAGAGCGGGDHGGSAGGGARLVVGVDLPLQGASRDASEATVNAMKLYLQQVNGKAGTYQVEVKVYDDATAAKGAWDDATCAKNAQDHVANENEVAVVGPYNSGCAKIEVPVLNQDPNGPMLIVSHTNTNPGLTKAWDPGEPEKFYPTGKRNYARVITTDDYQGSAAAQFAAKDLQVKRCYVLDDNQTYGQGVAKVFTGEAARNGVAVVGRQSWDARQPNYEAMFTQIKATNPDCVYLGGIFDNNGAQLIKDKVKVLGDNTAVKLIAPDGFTGLPDLVKLSEAANMYLTFAGMGGDALRSAGGAGGRLLDAYRARYGSDPATNYAIYGVQSLQVVLAAVERSDGSRRGVRDQVLGGAGISIPAATAVLGKDFRIDPKTGDASVRDISVERVSGNREVFLKPWPLA